MLNGKIFVIAGFDGAGEPSNSVFVYDPASDRWSSAAQLPIGNHHPGAVVARGTLFAFGGLSNRMFAYDPARDAWVDVAPSRFRHGDTPAVGVLDDRIYVAGGTGAGMIGNELESYDPPTNTWATLAPMRDRLQNSRPNAGQSCRAAQCDLRNPAKWRHEAFPGQRRCPRSARSSFRQRL